LAITFPTAHRAEREISSATTKLEIESASISSGALVAAPRPGDGMERSASFRLDQRMDAFVSMARCAPQAADFATRPRDADDARRRRS